MPVVKKPRIFLLGFTLVELLVSISIMAIISGIVLSGGPQALIRYSLENDAYRTQVLLQESQLQGSAVNSLNNIYGGAGVIFDLASSSQVIKFKDKVIPDERKAISVGNGLFDESNDETSSLITLVNRNRIGKFCLATSTQCHTATSTLTVSFIRPKQSANIYWNNSTTTNYTSACIEVQSLKAPAQGFVHSIIVYKSGLIIKKTMRCSDNRW